MGHEGVATIAHAIAGPQSDPAHTDANAGPADKARTTTTIVTMDAKRFTNPPALDSCLHNNKSRAILGLRDEPVGHAAAVRVPPGHLATSASLAHVAPVVLQRPRELVEIGVP
jgi:hypothetical protein